MKQNSLRHSSNRQISRMRRDRRKDRLYVSLHGPDDATRRQVIPIARYYPLNELLAEMTRYAEQEFGKVHVSYLLLPGVNDTQQHRDQLSAVIRGRPLFKSFCGSDLSRVRREMG
ncbi:hypothetical protein I6F29_32865 [Bradyrhizobium sp. NBAIM16]|uniref:hypothetical protein n=1 Tax=Bradyrhizobium sp. NBAIM16 TaxID=2793813 RepID=UPI001CD3E073|nr:hypothetical protein [Bradyrhizobium sp. NBAIM16]MCA1430679.1 hypothetical protein [Bradyrhizobium sp. NBAIM16]